MSGAFNLVTNVYFVACNDTYVKVGIAFDIPQRIGELQVGCPYELNLIAIIPGVAPSFEKLIHAYLADKHIRGEWFSLDADLRGRIALMQERLRSGRRDGEPIGVATDIDVAFLLDSRTARKRATQRGTKKQLRRDYFQRLADKGVVCYSPRASSVSPEQSASPSPAAVEMI